MNRPDTIPDPNPDSRPDLAIIRREYLQELRDSIDRVFDTLPRMERSILEQRFGYFSESRPRMTLEHVAREFEVTADRIMQIEERAMRIMSQSGTQSAPAGSSVSAEATVATCSRLSTDLIAHLRAHHNDISTIPPAILEHLVAEFFASWGYTDVRTVGRDSSTGADVHAVLVEPHAGIEQRLFIEVKRYNSPIEIDAIRTIHGAISLEKYLHGWNLGMVVTTSTFRDYAIAKEVEFNHFGVSLKSGSDLRRWLDEYIPSPNGLWLPNPQTKMPTSTRTSRHLNA